MSSESFEAFEKANKDPKLYEDDVYLRGLLLDFIADFANWDNSTNEHYLETGRALTDAAHIANGGEPGTRPLVVDPFAGGGAIPLEALRVGADAFASDLNPVAVLLNKVVLEYIPKYGQRLADEVRKWGAWVKKEAEKELAEFYPKDPDGSTPIAYLWARTITCEGPGCGAEVPLMRSLWLAKKGKRSVALKITPNQSKKRVDFSVLKNATKVGDGTVKRGSATCPICSYTTPVTSVRQQMRTRRGGAGDSRLTCVVTTTSAKSGREFREATSSDERNFRSAGDRLKEMEEQTNGDVSLVPNETLPIMSGVFNAPIYGHNTWGSLFTPRQALSLVVFARLVGSAGKHLRKQHDKTLADAVETCLALAVDKLADSNSSLCSWRATSQDIGHTFGRQAIPMLWDYVEANVLSGATRDWSNAVEGGLKALESLDSEIKQGQVFRVSATEHPLPDDAASAFITDPPYYNAVPYADLSDFFYVWLKRTLSEVHPELLATKLAPKDAEITEMAGWDSDRYAHKDKAFYEREMGKAMLEGRRVLAPYGIGLVVFAHKSTSGWEAQLQAMVDAGWTITGSWAIDTEMGTRLRAQNSAALASSIHLVCRPREDTSGELTIEIGDWRDVLRELPERIHEWMPRLAKEGVVGADAIFACLGPALEIFSRYSSVEKPSGEVVKLREYLEHVWAAVAKEALNMIFSGADTAGFEEDARLTAMWLWTLFSGSSSTKEDTGSTEDDADADEETSSSKGGTTSGYMLEYDAARKIAQGLGAHLEDLDTVVEVKGDKARLLPVGERARDLFGYEGSSATEGKKKKKSKAQAKLFTEMEDDEYETVFGVGGAPKSGETTLDRVHQTMLLFGAGRSEAVKRFLADDGIGNDERFWRLANALSALYPTGSEEKRWVDGVLARKKGLGF